MVSGFWSHCCSRYGDRDHPGIVTAVPRNPHPMTKQDTFTGKGSRLGSDVLPSASRACSSDSAPRT